MGTEEHQLAELFPNVASQLREALSSLHLAASQLAPAAQRERDPELDARAALLDQSYFRILRLVNNLTAAALLQREEPLPLQDGDIVALTEELFERCVSLADQAGIHLAFSCGPESHLCAFCPQAIEQLLYQLLSNALKFTPRGGVVTVELRFAAGQVLLTVADTGCGIDEAHLNTLFARYSDAGEMEPMPHGLGLGLALCRRIAQDHGGSLVAQSQVGKGSRFTMAFPDRKTGITGLSDVRMDYNGGFNGALLALADALPPEAFLLRNQD